MAPGKAVATGSKRQKTAPTTRKTALLRSVVVPPTILTRTSARQRALVQKRPVLPRTILPLTQKKSLVLFVQTATSANQAAVASVPHKARLVSARLPVATTQPAPILAQGQAFVSST